MAKVIGCFCDYGPLLDPLPQQALPCRGDAFEQDLADEVVAEAEAETVDAEHAPLAEPFEVFDKRGCLELEHLREQARLEGLLEQGCSREGAAVARAFGTALCDQRFGERPRRSRFLAAAECFGDKAGVAAGRFVEPGDPEWRDVMPA